MAGVNRFFGTFQMDGTELITTDAISASVVGLTWLETDAVRLDMFGTSTNRPA